MEPVLGGRDDDGGQLMPWFRLDAAMEPVLGGRDDSRRGCCRPPAG